MSMPFARNVRVGRWLCNGDYETPVKQICELGKARYEAFAVDI